MSGVDNYAHAGGFLGGWLAARVLDPLKPERGNHLLIGLGCVVSVGRCRSPCPSSRASVRRSVRDVLDHAEAGHSRHGRVWRNRPRPHRSAGIVSTVARVVTLDVQPLGAGARRRGPARDRRVDSRCEHRSSACWPSTRWTWSFIWRRCCPRGRSSRRPRRTTSTWAARCRCSSSPSSRPSRTAGRSSFCIRHPLRSTACRRSKRKRAPARVREDQWNAADDDVRVQQVLLRTPRPLLRASLQAVVGGAPERRRGFPRVAISRPDLRDDRALGRHVRLRAGNGARRRGGPALRLLRAARHADSVHGDARCGERARRAGSRGSRPR